MIRTCAWSINNILLAFAMAWQQLFGGLLIALESLPPWVQWLKYFSFIRYGIEVSCVQYYMYRVYSNKTQDLINASKFAF